MRGGGPLCGEEAFCVGRRPSVRGGGPLCGKEVLCAGGDIFLRTPDDLSGVEGIRSLHRGSPLRRVGLPFTQKRLI